ncbi:MAG: AbrB/MazE/SpoVT family DNA-binding domain-containing protein [Verrucomicrobiaceae bacterium]
MDTAILNSKGQITIPSALRKKLGLETGTKLRLFSSSGGNDINIAPTGSVHDLAGILPKPAKAMSIDEINAGIERAAADESATSS